MHGRGDTGARFAAALAPLVAALEAEVGGRKVLVVAPDAPVVSARAWYTQSPAGSRSYAADAFEGVANAAEVLREARGTGGEPFDAAVGHSQGAILLAVLLAQRAALRDEHDELVSGGVLLSGAAWPRPYADVLEHATGRVPQRTMHSLSPEDDINPPEGALRVAELFGGEVLEHGYGHTLPLGDPEAVATMARFLAGT